MQELSTPDKKRFQETKDQLKTMDCELVVTLHGFQDTYDSDGDLDEDTVQVGTESAAESVADAIALLGKEEVVQRKIATPQAIKLWVPRNGHYSGYKMKKSVAAKLKIHQLDGYKEKQVFCYITADGSGPVLEQPEEEAADEAKTEEEDPQEDYKTPPGSPRKSQAPTATGDTETEPPPRSTSEPSPSKSTQSKRSRADAEKDEEEDGEPKTSMDLDKDPSELLDEETKRHRITEDPEEQPQETARKDK